MVDLFLVSARFFLYYLVAFVNFSCRYGIFFISLQPNSETTKIYTNK